ncbi:MAG: DUF2130 domain-containing protein [Burkholderiales bacterium]|nr:DUF2130 domain-containing protein [Burkholderiales bacterium]
MNNYTINCPQCGTSIDVNEVLSHQLEDEIKKKYATELVKEKHKYDSEFAKIEQVKKSLAEQQEHITAQIEKSTREQVQAEKIKLEAKLREQINYEQADVVKSLQNELNLKSQQVQELNNSKAEIERLKREKDELQSNITAQAEQNFNQQLRQEREKIQKQISEASALKMREKEEQLNILRNQLQEAQRKAEQGSMQLQGEVQELAIEEWLTERFPFDSIEEIKKGQRGADCMQIVHTREIQNCGKIYYESKRTKDFSNQWIEKFKADMREKSADIGVLITDSYPKGVERICLIEGVWICSYEEFKGLVSVLREHVIKIHLAMRSQENKTDKMDLLYQYLTSNEFRMQVEAIVEGFTQLQVDLDSEKRAMARIWKQREKQIEKVIDNTINMHSSIKGIAGSAIASIKSLELPHANNNLLENE